MCVHGKKKSWAKPVSFFGVLEKGKKMVHDVVYCRNGLPTPGGKSFGVIVEAFMHNMHSGFVNLEKKLFPILPGLQSAEVTATHY